MKIITLLIGITLLTHSGVYAQEKSQKYIANLIWNNQDSTNEGLKRFYLDSIASAHIFYLDTSKKLIQDTLKFLTMEGNVYIFKKFTQQRNCLLLFISAKDSINLEVTFDKIPEASLVDNFRSRKSWKNISGQDTRIPDISNGNLFENRIMYFKNLTCCSNHKEKHCGSKWADLEKLSKSNSCVF